MPKRSRKDINQVAHDLVQQVTQGKRAKNPAAVALGRLGGLKGGKARARKLTRDQRKASAAKAAQARWHRNEVA